MIFNHQVYGKGKTADRYIHKIKTTIQKKTYTHSQASYSVQHNIIVLLS